jgi:hypothetical protein
MLLKTTATDVTWPMPLTLIVDGYAEAWPWLGIVIGEGLEYTWAEVA